MPAGSPLMIFLPWGPCCCVRCWCPLSAPPSSSAPDIPVRGRAPSSPEHPVQGLVPLSPGCSSPEGPPACPLGLLRTFQSGFVPLLCSVPLRFLQSRGPSSLPSCSSPDVPVRACASSRLRGPSDVPVQGGAFLFLGPAPDVPVRGPGHTPLDDPVRGCGPLHP